MISHEMAYGGLANPYSGPSRYLSDGVANSAAANDAAYHSMYEAAEAATTIEELQRIIKGVGYVPVRKALDRVGSCESNV